MTDKFDWEPDDISVTQCLYCKHADHSGPVRVCAAFPGAIPIEIAINQFDHRKPWIDPATGEPGDRGVALDRSILFEPKGNVPEEALQALYRQLDALD